MIHPSKVLLEKGLHAVKSFGQNFLVTQSTLDGLEEILDSKKAILEIGPGLGAVTEFLTRNNFKTTAIEKDKKLAVYLQEELKDNVEIIQADFLQLPVEFFIERKISQIIGNLPFYITTDIIVKVIKELTMVDTFVLGIQKEVGDRLLKTAGNSFALFVNAAGDLKRFRTIGKNNFYPVPDVDASWLIWKRNQKVGNLDTFEVFLRGLFWAKRKNIYNTLAKNPFFENFTFTEKWLKKIKEREAELGKKRADGLSFQEVLTLFHEITAT